LESVATEFEHNIMSNMSYSIGQVQCTTLVILTLIV